MLKKSKYKFLLSEEKYLDFKINKEGTVSLSKKVAVSHIQECYWVQSLSWSSEQPP